jgi:MOSC domain-containing protein YiiM
MGVIAAIYLTPEKEAAANSVRQAKCVPGSGLEGDRYAKHAGTFSKPGAPDREVTLIEAEAIEAANREYKASLDPAATRRNVVTSGVALNHLVGRDFRVGHVVFRGIRLCEPCGHLAKLTSPEAERALVHRGGLRAQVVTAGTIHVGDEIEEMPKALANAV